jgi:hypothetical protein
MKNLKSILVAFALVIVSTIVKADEPEAAKLSKSYALTTYVNAVSLGKVAGLSNVIDENAKFSMMRGNKMLTFTRAEMLDFLKNEANVKQNCTVSTSIVEKDSNNDVSVVKVDMQYDGFVRSNYVTLSNTGNGWKVTNVYSVFR